VTIRQTDIIEDFVKEKLGDEFKGLNFKPRFENFDIDIVVLTESYGFIKFPVRFTDLIELTPEETHNYILNGLKEVIDREINDDKSREP
jgi:hypothetical protein